MQVHQELTNGTVAHAMELDQLIDATAHRSEEIAMLILEAEPNTSPPKRATRSYITLLDAQTRRQSEADWHELIRMLKNPGSYLVEAVTSIQEKPVARSR